MSEEDITNEATEIKKLMSKKKPKPPKKLEDVPKEKLIKTIAKKKIGRAHV